MQDRTCRVCGEQFAPTLRTQVCCPPTDADRARAAQPRSRCAKRYGNANYRNQTEKATCKGCGRDFDRPRGERHKVYCTTECQYRTRSAEYAGRRDLGRRFTEKEMADRAAAKFLAGLTTLTKRDVARYRRALRSDPCAYCGETTVGIDHIEPTHHGGSGEWDNLTAACKRCNETKRALPLLLALPWIPLSKSYHDARRALFTPRGKPLSTLI